MTDMYEQINEKSELTREQLETRLENMTERFENMEEINKELIELKRSVEEMLGINLNDLVEEADTKVINNDSEVLVKVYFEKSEVRIVEGEALC